MDFYYPTECKRNKVNFNVTVLELKSKLKELNLPTSGLKDALINRLAFAELPMSYDIFKDSPKVSNVKNEETKIFNFTKSGPVIKRVPKGSRL